MKVCSICWLLNFICSISIYLGCKFWSVGPNFCSENPSNDLVWPWIKKMAWKGCHGSMVVSLYYRFGPALLQERKGLISCQLVPRSLEYSLIRSLHITFALMGCPLHDQSEARSPHSLIYWGYHWPIRRMAYPCISTGQGQGKGSLINSYKRYKKKQNLKWFRNSELVHTTIVNDSLRYQTLHKRGRVW